MAGCGGGSGARVPVNGEVRLDGKPLPNVRVTFIPEKGTEGVGGFGETGSDGRFVIADTKQGKPGLAPGKYKVTVNKGVLKNATGEEPVGAVIPELDLRDEFPPYYSSPADTILSYTVLGDGKPIIIELESKKKK
ncbi:MAG: carboxypeptidase-like regulatory domain-containing protein [Gemmataceae bacterium]|nr:carboxypeptidase-like regulatory domain-containing protein [Gemmataceae bacterium]